MTVGPGKYDDLCTMVREKAVAAAAIVIIIGGNKGHGFSVQAIPGTADALPELLEEIVKQLRERKG